MQDMTLKSQVFRIPSNDPEMRGYVDNFFMYNVERRKEFIEEKKSELLKECNVNPGKDGYLFEIVFDSKVNNAIKKH